ncbi:MAG: MFS transporter [Candidatus Methylomirabilota bacterium]
MSGRRSAATSWRGWVVVGASFVTMALLYGLWYSYAVFLVALIREFGWSRGLLAGAFSTFALVHGGVGPFFGKLAERWGPRRVILAGACIVGAGLLLAAETSRWWHLYAAFGVIAALGIGLCGYVPLILLIRGWFPDRIGTVSGIATAGISIGVFSVVPLTQFMIDQIGWRWALRVLAGLVVIWMIPATCWLLREAPGGSGFSPEPDPSGPLRELSPRWTLAAALRCWKFWGLGVALFTSNTAITILMIHQVAYLVDHGVAAMVAATVAGLVGLFSAPGKMGWGYLLDRMPRETVYSLSSTAFLGSLGVLVLSGNYPGSLLPYAYAVLLGIGYAVTAPLTPAVVGDLFRGPAFPTIFGAVHVSLGFGTAMGAWAGGAIYDATGGYAAALWAAGGLTLFSVVLLFCVAPRHPNPPPAPGRP